MPLVALYTLALKADPHASAQSLHSRLAVVDCPGPDRVPHLPSLSAAIIADDPKHTQHAEDSSALTIARTRQRHDSLQYDDEPRPRALLWQCKGDEPWT